MKNEDVIKAIAQFSPPLYNALMATRTEEDYKRVLEFCVVSMATYIQGMEKTMIDIVNSRPAPSLLERRNTIGEIDE